MATGEAAIAQLERDLAAAQGQLAQAEAKVAAAQEDAAEKEKIIKYVLCMQPKGACCGRVRGAAFTGDKAFLQDGPFTWQ